MTRWYAAFGAGCALLAACSAPAPDQVEPVPDQTEQFETARPLPAATADGMAKAVRPAELPWADIDTARKDLATLRVKGRAPMTGYAREAYGSAWEDVNDNGCDTRNDILRRDLIDKDVSDCMVLAGVLIDPYSGDRVAFTRGRVTSMDVQIDHVVALANAWQTGAQSWPEFKRERFANDRRNLLAVRGDLNLQKGDGDAATWLPPRKGFRCTYVALQIQTKARYDLWLTPSEKAAMGRILDSC